VREAAVDAEAERAVDLCVLALLEAAPGLALDPQSADLGWDQLEAESDTAELRATVIGFACSEPVRAWARHIEEIDREDRSDEWDEFWSESLILAEVVIQAIEVFDGRASWDAALQCETVVGYYRDHIWDRSTPRSLSNALSGGVRLEDLAREAIEDGRALARNCLERHERASRPWPPRMPSIPPPGTRPPSRS
jgi:hypothetical protein